MIEAVLKKGASRARALCDQCGREEIVHCTYERPVNGLSRPNEGQVRKKLTAMGWDASKGKLHCPACAARKRAFAHQENEDQTNMVKAAVKTSPAEKSPSEDPPREPGYRMIGMICDMLNVAYDRTRKGYSNPADNDRTIADAIGEGCMWGWVARIREAEYGPDQRWAEIDAIRAELRDAAMKAAEESDRLAEEAESRIAELLAPLNARTQKVAADLIVHIEALQARVNALDPSVGPKARKV